MSKLYTENVHVPYDSPQCYHHEKVAELVSKYSADKQLSILDCGCGLGNTSLNLNKIKPSCKITATDIDPKCLDITSKNADIEKLLHITDISDLFDKKEKYDAIILSHVLEHLPHPVDSVLGLLNMLQPNGILVLAVPNSVTPLSILSSLLRWHNVNRGHIFAWDRSTWRVFLEDIVKADIVEHSQDLVPLPYIWTRKFFQPFLKALTIPFPWFSFSHISVIKKPQ